MFNIRQKVEDRNIPLHCREGKFIELKKEIESLRSLQTLIIETHDYMISMQRIENKASVQFKFYDPNMGHEIDNLTQANLMALIVNISNVFPTDKITYSKYANISPSEAIEARVNEKRAPSPGAPGGL